jgi:hypothetical protein
MNSKTHLPWSCQLTVVLGGVYRLWRHSMLDRIHVSSQEYVSLQFKPVQMFDRRSNMLRLLVELRHLWDRLGTHFPKHWIIVSALNTFATTAIRVIPKMSSSARRLCSSRTAVGWSWTCGRFKTYLRHSENVSYQSQTFVRGRVFSTILCIWSAKNFSWFNFLFR